MKGCRPLLAMVVWLAALVCFGEGHLISGSVAVSGYDPVAYFTEGEPVKGSEEFHLEYMGADWYFSSEENRELFRENPEGYAPQYGGYCAWAVANDYTAPGNPKDWTVHEGKLYLNYNSSIHRRWRRNMEEFIRQANQNWPGVVER